MNSNEMNSNEMNSNKMNLNNESVFTFSEKKFLTGSATDIGGSRENQDNVCCFQNSDILANCIFDGHGPDGKWIAEVCKLNTERLISENSDRILLDPVNTLSELFSELKTILSVKTVERFSQKKRECKIEPSGVIIIKDLFNDFWQPLVNGGATMTVLILIKKTLKLYIANVGDSDAMLCSSKQIFRQDDLKCETGLKDGERCVPVDDNLFGGVKLVVKEEEHCSWGVRGVPVKDYIMLTANHSPTNIDEYVRMRSKAACPTNPNKSLIDVVYDKQYVETFYQVYDTSAPIPKLLECPLGGGYYKNVRKENATYVRTKENRKLAFTRTMGDFEMDPYGIISEPSISSINLSDILERYTETDLNPVLCLFVSSDGVWDNWEYQKVQEFLMYGNCLEAAGKTDDGSQKVLDSFMARNNLFARQNFGKTADNATSAILYVKK
jgi:serine/threonine protein phosphatase PrpC